MASTAEIIAALPKLVYMSSETIRLVEEGKNNKAGIHFETDWQGSLTIGRAVIGKSGVDGLILERDVDVKLDLSGKFYISMEGYRVTKESNGLFALYEPAVAVARLSVVASWEDLNDICAFRSMLGGKTSHGETGYEIFVSEAKRVNLL